MKRLPVFETTKYAYKFFFANFGKFIPLLLQYSFVYFLLYAFIYLIQNHFNSSDVFVSNLLNIVECLTFWLILPIEINVIRAIVSKEKVERNFFKSLLSLRTWRVVLMFILSYLATLGPMGITFLLAKGWAPAFSFFAFQGFGLNGFIAVFLLFSLIWAIYVGMRLSLSIVTSTLDHKTPIKHSWRITEDSLPRLLMISILTSIPFFLPADCLKLIFKLPVDIKHSNPLIEGLISLPADYLRLLMYAGTAYTYMHLNKYNNNE